MIKYNCPSCAAELEFKSNISVYAVCPYCASMIVRRDTMVGSIGKMATLPDEITPLQLGTSGRFGKDSFTIIGRARMKWAGGFWNEWFLYMDDGTRAWLAEAQGTYAISTEVEDFRKKDSLNIPKLGTYVQINKQKYYVTDVKQAECIGSEGELPYEAAKGRMAKYIDMLGRDGEFASIEFSGEGQRAYIGQYAEFPELNLQNLRELDGWRQG